MTGRMVGIADRLHPWGIREVNPHGRFSGDETTASAFVAALRSPPPNDPRCLMNTPWLPLFPPYSAPPPQVMGYSGPNCTGMKRDVPG